MKIKKKFQTNDGNEIILYPHKGIAGKQLFDFPGYSFSHKSQKFMV